MEMYAGNSAMEALLQSPSTDLSKVQPKLPIVVSQKYFYTKLMAKIPNTKSILLLYTYLNIVPKQSNIYHTILVHWIFFLMNIGNNVVSVHFFNWLPGPGSTSLNGSYQPSWLHPRTPNTKSWKSRNGAHRQECLR